MNKKLCPVLVALLFWTVLGAAQNAEATKEQSFEDVSLVVPSGAPLRVYLTKRVPKTLNEPVQARLIDPVFAFDKEVVPAGTDVLGRVTRLAVLSKTRRAMAILGGDFTPLHEAEVEFTSLVLPDGRHIPVRTAETQSLNSIFTLNPRKKSTKNKPGGILGDSETASTRSDPDQD